MREARSGDVADSLAAAAPRLRRTARREQIIDAATEAFARAGFSATGLDDIAREARVSRAILYRHFDSKADLYRAVLDRARQRLVNSVPGPEFEWASVDALVAAAAADPAGFRVLFRHAAREPEFHDEIDRFLAQAVARARRQVVSAFGAHAWSRWAAQLAPTVAIEAVLAWLDAGQPDRDQAAARIRQAIDGVIAAARRA
ncbi:MAG: helix-turn-helix domain-containing protein [Candidatus Limnocylindria bacterium]